MQATSRNSGSPSVRRRKSRIRRSHRDRASHALKFETEAMSGKNNAFTDKALMIVMCLLMVPIIGYSLYLMSGKPKSSRDDGIAPHVFAENPYVMTEREAFHLVRNALGSTTESEIADRFMPSEFLTTSQMLDWVRQRRDQDGTIIRLQRPTPGIFNSPSQEAVLVRFDKNPSKTWRIAHLDHNHGGTWKIDFDSFARICSPSFEDVASGYSGEALLRVFLKPDHYYNGAFSSEKEWQSFKLWSLDHEQSLMAYIEIGSPQHQLVMEILSMDRESHPVTLMIERLGDPSLNQYKINRVLSDGWHVGKTESQSQ